MIVAPQPANVHFFPIEFPQNASRLSKKEIHTDWELSISMLDYPGAYHQHLSIVKQQDSHGFRHSDTYDSHYLATNFNTNIKSCFLCLADSSWITHSKLKKAKVFPWTTWMNSRFRLFKPSAVRLRHRLRWRCAKMARRFGAVRGSKRLAPRAVEFTVGQCPWDWLIRLTFKQNGGYMEEGPWKYLNFDFFSGWKESHLKR